MRSCPTGNREREMSCEELWRAYLESAARHEQAAQALHKQPGSWASAQEDVVPSLTGADFRERARLYEQEAAAQAEAIERFTAFYREHKQHQGQVQSAGQDVAVS